MKKSPGWEIFSKSKTLLIAVSHSLVMETRLIEYVRLHFVAALLLHFHQPHHQIVAGVDGVTAHLILDELIV